MEDEHWTTARLEAVNKAQTFSDLLLVAHEILDSIRAPVGLVSGPISTGGLGSSAKNLKVFETAISALQKRGEHIFNQLPFENKFAELARNHHGYFTPILEEFFLPILKSGKIAKIFFLPGWKTSVGASWEYDIADKLGLERFMLADTPV